MGMNMSFLSNTLMFLFEVHDATAGRPSLFRVDMKCDVKKCTIELGCWDSPRLILKVQ
jgi:hypothetical protein